MANDRVMLRCDSCGAFMMFLKHYPGLLGTYSEDWTAKFLAWTNAHCRCHPHFFHGDLCDNPGFSLHTEGSEALDYTKQNAPPPTNAPATVGGYADLPQGKHDG